MSNNSVHRSVGEVPDKRFDDGFADAVSAGESRVKKIDDARIPLEMAKAQLGRAFRRTVSSNVDQTSSAFGDPGQVSRLSAGNWPEPVLNAWRDEDTRREFVRNLAIESGLFDERFSLEERERKRA